MKNLKKLSISILSLALVAILSIGGTIAYLTSEDSDVNVMTMGNVKIEQIEQEWNEAGELVDFTQAKPLYPYVGELGWTNKDYENGAYRKFTMENVVDKYVSVKNTGKSDAYVRTIIALEMGDFTYQEFKQIGISTNAEFGAEFKFPGAWEWTDDFETTIDGKRYNIMVAVHKDPLAAGETTIPSLLQVYLSKDANNDDCEKLDGNGNGTYDILVFSQGVQTNGFDNAKQALNTAFGEITTANHPWKNGVSIGVTVNTEEELLNAVKNGHDIVLGKDIELKAPETVINKDLTIYLNGKTLTAYRNHRSGLTVKDVSTLTIDGANVVIKGEGKVLNIGDNTAYAVGIINHGKVTIDGGYYQAFHDTFYVKTGTLEILAGKFNTIGDDTPYAVKDLEQHTNTYADCFSNSVINCDDDYYTTGKAHVIVKGGSFRNFNPSNVHEGRFHHQNHVAAGYKVVASELDENNDIWYTVVAE